MDDLPIPPGGLSARLEALGVRRREAIVVAAVVAGVVLVVFLVAARRAPAVIAPPATSAPSGAPPASAPSSPQVSLYVHVAGHVRAPGLYGLPAGARVADAIEAAGGARRSADLDAVNLAQVLTDGLKIDVPTRGAARLPAADPSSSATPGPVSINSADRTALEIIPGIGPVKAAAIVQHRTDNGAFSSLDQLLDVSGIGPATLESIRPYISL